MPLYLGSQYFFMIYVVSEALESENSAGEGLLPRLRITFSQVLLLLLAWFLLSSLRGGPLLCTVGQLHPKLPVIDRHARQHLHSFIYLLHRLEHQVGVAHLTSPCHPQRVYILLTELLLELAHSQPARQISNIHSWQRPVGTPPPWATWGAICSFISSCTWCIFPIACASAWARAAAEVVSPALWGWPVLLVDIPGFLFYVFSSTL